MANITWDTSAREYSTGVDMVALYIGDNTPIAWEGVTAVNEAPSGAESNKLYANNQEYLNLLSKEEFGCSIEAYCSPEEFDACDGMAVAGGSVKVHAQQRAEFAFAYRVLLGNKDNPADTDVKTRNCEYHIVYGCRAGAASRDNATINDSPEAGTFSWDITTMPVSLSALGAGYKETAHIVIDCTGVSATTLTNIQNLLYSKERSGVPTIAELNALVVAN